MTNLANRLLEQLRRLGSMAAVAVPAAFGVTEDDASAAITELINDKRAYRAGARVFASALSSLRTDIRNPMLALPSMQRAIRMGKLERIILRDLCRELATDAHAKAEKCWQSRKGPMAAYWRSVGVYAGHIARALNQSLKRAPVSAEGDR